MRVTSVGLTKTAFALIAAFAAAIASGAEPAGSVSAAVQRELVEARLLSNHAEYTDAYKLYAQVLAFDPVNKAAFEGRRLIKQTFALPGWTEAGSFDETYPANPTPYNSTIEPWAGKDLAMVYSLKLSKIIVPEVLLNGVRVVDAVEFFQHESHRLDPDPNTDARGIKISLVPPKNGLSKYELPARLPEQADARIFLRLRNASLDEALDFVAYQVGLRVAVYPDQITLVQADTREDNGLVVRRFRAWPELTEALNPAVKPNYSSTGYPILGGRFEIPRADAKPFLEAKGIAFPSGATAAYLPPGSVFMSNDLENLARLEALVDRSDEVGPPPADKNP